MIRALLMGLTLSMSLMACGSGTEAASQLALQKTSDVAAIDQLEVSFHRAASTHDLNLMMSLWSDDAVLTAGQQTLTGKVQIRQFMAQSGPFNNNWISDTPAYKMRIAVDGDRGTLYFECHYADVATRQLKSLAAADTKVARIGGHWLFTNAVVGTAILS
jgi:ketosteroid isomerase-like protein